MDKLVGSMSKLSPELVGVGAVGVLGSLMTAAVLWTRWGVASGSGKGSSAWRRGGAASGGMQDGAKTTPVSTNGNDVHARPKHVAIVMDGNRRYGRLKSGNAMSGHWEGGKTLVNVIEWCVEEGLDMLTVYAFSTENWSRDAAEVDTLMTIFVQYATTLLEEALKNNVRVKVLCTDGARLPAKVSEATKELEAKTGKCTGFLVNVCLSYGSRADIVQAAQALAEEVAAGIRTAASIDEEALASRLVTAGLPDPDILIRTSGEYRLSNFLLWQLAYTEMFFIDKLWPELSRNDLTDIFQQYSERARRFGK